MVVASATKGIFIVAAKRTPFGSFGGSLKSLSATRLAVESSKAALSEAKMDPKLIDDVYVGSVLHSNHDASYLARHVGLMSGVDVTKPALTINRLCGSGFETVIQGAKSLALGHGRVALCAGTENMSMAPLVVSGLNVRFKQGVPLGKGLHLRDSLWDGLTDAYANTAMGMTAENLAKQYNITRRECDEYALSSQQRWASSNFQNEMAPITIQDKKKKTDILIDTDEHPRPNSTVEQMEKLKPVFIPDDGVVTAANASGICDGAGTILLATEDAVRDYNLSPLARLVSYSIVGCPPEIMGIGPVQAITNALQVANLDLSSMKRVEINEAFAAQVLSCIKALQLNPNDVNIHGGAISLGHPLGASGSRIVAHLVHDETQTTGDLSVGAACIGGGQGIAVVLERM